MKLYRSNLLENIPEISHGFGTAGVGIDKYLDGVIIHQTNQVHGNTVHVLGSGLGFALKKKPDPGFILQGDAFITSQPGVACFVRTADCVPILVADPVKKVVGAIHAGWRGTVFDVVGAAIRKIQEAFGSNPADIRTAIGPAICGKCYEVDLPAINHKLLVRAGVKESNVDTLKKCTCCCVDEFASYRRDQTDIRQVNFIMLSRRR